MKNNIKELRKEHQMTQKDLADRCEVSRQTINMIENDKYDPSLQLALKIAQEFQMSVEDIFFL